MVKITSVLLCDNKQMPDWWVFEFISENLYQRIMADGFVA
jgi:hypothetical protein